MRKTPPIAWFFGLLAFAACCFGGFFVMKLLKPAPGSGNLHYVHKVDPELQNAIDTARRNLPQFRAQFAHPESDIKSFALKVKIGGTGENATMGPEYLWVDHLKVHGDDFEGIFADEPVLDKSKHKGDPTLVKEADIVDWIILYQNGQYDGGYTNEVLKKLAS